MKYVRRRLLEDWSLSAVERLHARTWTTWCLVRDELHSRDRQITFVTYCGVVMANDRDQKAMQVSLGAIVGCAACLTAVSEERGDVKDARVAGSSEVRCG